MDHLSFFHTLLARENAEGTILCTIIAEEGSTPRDAGTFMAVFPDGTVTGTVGGGAVERMAIDFAAACVKKGEPVNTVRNYDMLGNTNAAKTGMICGGAISVLFRTLDCDALAVLSALKKIREGTRELYLVLPLPDAASDPDTADGSAAADAPGTGNPSGPSPLPPLMLCEKDTLPEHVRDRKGTRPVLHESFFYSPVVSFGIVYLFGLGHVGRALFPVLRSVRFPVVVIDDRQDALADQIYDDAARKIHMPFQSFTEKLPLTKHDYVVVCTTGHHGDYEVLAQTLPFEPAYVGCIGSTGKAAAVRQRLLDAGFDRTLVGRIHSPIGLKIRAQTPAEIAISIAAEMILCRANLQDG